MSSSLTLFLLKLALVAASILGATLAARRWGHATSGLMAGLPMIIGPITAILLVDQSAARVRDILLATLQAQPAMLMHILAFAYAARRWSWPMCLLAANGVYLAFALLLTRIDLAPAAAIALVALTWWSALRLMPRHDASVGAARVQVPRSELWWRLSAALAVAGGVIQGASSMPAAWGGVLLAAPITGNVLPAFTLPRHGAAATTLLLRGFVHGQLGFAAFVTTMVLLLPLLHPAAAWTLAVTAATLAPWLDGLRRRRTAAAAAGT
jgi:hypothetical protein